MGNVDGTNGDTGLTPAGRAQAIALRARLAGFEFDRVLSSPLLRARETAQLAVPEAEVEVDTRLRELVVAPETFIDVNGLGRAELMRLLESAREEEARFVGRSDLDG